MKKIGRFIPVLLALFALLAPFGAWAKSPDPFAGPSKDMSVKARYALIASLPANNPARVQFFSESQKNTGLSEAELSELVRTGKTKVITCKDKCKLETAGLLNGKAVYWRNVNEKEAVVIVPKGEWWVPWFVLGCNNPVRPPVVATAPAPQGLVVAAQTPPPSEVRMKLVKCTQQGSMYIPSATTVYDGYNSHQFYGVFTPTWCVEYEEIIKK